MKQWERKWKVLFLVVSLVVAVGGVFTLVCLVQDLGAPTYLHAIYPDTESAPSLHFYWDDSDLTNKTLACYAYGGWEGGGGYYVYGCEPDCETCIFFNYTGPQNMYAYCKGTITDLTGDGTDGSHAKVMVRYGRNYGVLYHHLVNLASGIKVGATVDTGEILGQTAMIDTGGGPVSFWEVGFTKMATEITGWQVPIVDYFDSESQQLFGYLLGNSTGPTYTSWTMDPDPVPGTNNETKGDSFIDEAGGAIWPASVSEIGISGSRVPGYEDAVEAFLDEKDLLWILA